MCSIPCQNPQAPLSDYRRVLPQILGSARLVPFHVETPSPIGDAHYHSGKHDNNADRNVSINIIQYCHTIAPTSIPLDAHATRPATQPNKVTAMLPLAVLLDACKAQGRCSLPQNLSWHAAALHSIPQWQLRAEQGRMMGYFPTQSL
jgi:hypothetical protein